MSGGGKGGSQSSSVTIPQFMEDAAKKNLARADDVSQIGYTPYYGPDVAAFTPQQNAAFANTSQAADAFGMNAAQGNGMPPPQQFAGGMQGYSSGGLYDQALAELEARRPGQFGAINDMFIDPITGAPAVSQYAVAPPVVGGVLGGVTQRTDSDRDYAAHTQGVMDRNGRVSQTSYSNAKSGNGGIY